MTTTSRLSTTSDSQRGQATVEFAFVVVLLVFLLMGLFDLGRAIYAYNVVAGAAREGARYGITAPNSPAGIKSTAVTQAIGLAVNPADVQVQCEGVLSSDCPLGGNLTVIVPYTFQPVTLFFASFTVTGKSTMVVAYHP